MTISKKKCLIIEDDYEFIPVIRAVVKDRLDITHVDDFKKLEAIDMDSFDIIICDINVGRTTLYEYLEKNHALDTGKTIIMSGWYDLVGDIYFKYIYLDKANDFRSGLEDALKLLIS